MRRRRLALTAVLAALAIGGAYAALAATRSDREPGDAQLRASADRQLDPVLVPRRHRPQVVEPEAGDVGGAADPEALAPPDPPAGGAVGGAGGAAGVDERRAEEDAGPPGGVPSDAEVRRELARLREVSRRYRYDELDFSGQLIPFDALPSDGWRQSIASVYYLIGQGLACGGVLRPEQLGVAHKTAPCGTLVTFRFGDRAIRVPVVDRGPYIIGREWDLTPATAAALGFPGLGLLEWRVSKLG